MFALRSRNPCRIARSLVWPVKAVDRPELIAHSRTQQAFFFESNVLPGIALAGKAAASSVDLVLIDGRDWARRWNGPDTTSRPTLLDVILLVSSA
jgi:hypothetical protein